MSPQKDPPAFSVVSIIAPDHFFHCTEDILKLYIYCLFTVLLNCELCEEGKMFFLPVNTPYLAPCLAQMVTQ